MGVRILVLIWLVPVPIATNLYALVAITSKEALTKNSAFVTE